MNHLFLVFPSTYCALAPPGPELGPGGCSRDQDRQAENGTKALGAVKLVVLCIVDKLRWLLFAGKGFSLSG